MNPIAKFIISKDEYIEIAIPELASKQNYYYKPTNELHMFDQITVNLVTDSDSTKLAQDSAYEVLNVFKISLQQVLNNERILPIKIDNGHIGEHYNTTIHEQNFDLYDYDQLLLWSSNGPQTWLYNRNDKIYLEVIPTYPRLFAESTEELDDISFEKFMRNYKPILVKELDRRTIQGWLIICNNILHSMIKV